ncbi:hypothetical protein [Shewanella algae]|uniref:hypothetical protein n=1 Tax=Shewanella algae TaxID=38313 RepID=UPI00313AAF3E
MKRLFISLYLLISLSFLGLGWTLDALWQQHDDEAELLADAPFDLSPEFKTMTLMRFPIH